MTRITLKQIVFLLLIAVVLSAAKPPVAREDFKTEWLEQPDPAHTKWRKLGRGLSNITLGATEIVYQPSRMMKEGTQWPVAILGGTVRGLFYWVGRIFVGVYEVLTFPFENPGGGYRPIIEPETPIPRNRTNEYTVS